MVNHKVLVAEFKHETNTFCIDKTGIKQFNDRYLKYGQEIVDFFEDAKVEMGGTFKVFDGFVQLAPLQVYKAYVSQALGKSGAGFNRLFVPFQAAVQITPF